MNHLGVERVQEELTSSKIMKKLLKSNGISIDEIRSIGFREPLVVAEQGREVSVGDAQQGLSACCESLSSNVQHDALSNLFQSLGYLSFN